jgi:hypothetical protein
VSAVDWRCLPGVPLDLGQRRTALAQSGGPDKRRARLGKRGTLDWSRQSEDAAIASTRLRECVPCQPPLSQFVRSGRLGRRRSRYSFQGDAALWEGVAGWCCVAFAHGIGAGSWLRPAEARGLTLSRGSGDVSRAPAGAESPRRRRGLRSLGGAGVYESVLVGEDHCLDAVAQVELLEHARDMRLGRSVADD